MIGVNRSQTESIHGCQFARGNDNAWDYERGSMILTDRLILRRFRMGEAAGIATLGNDLNISSMLMGMPYPYTTADAKRWLSRTNAMTQDGLLLQHAIVLRDNGKLAGTLSMKKGAPTDEVAELSYWLSKRNWGKGLVVEAACAAIANAVSRFSVTTIRAAAMKHNSRSVRVLEKLGFHEEGTHLACKLGQEQPVELRMFWLNFAS
jgi:RimJ/RimL family protein N-acetyltransferase